MSKKPKLKRWNLKDYGSPTYLDGAQMQCFICEGKYPVGPPIAYCNPEYAALFFHARETLEALKFAASIIGHPDCDGSKAIANAINRAEGRKL